MKRALGKHLLLLASVAALGFLVAPAKATAACEKCVDRWQVILSGGQSWCVPVKEDETGATLCTDGVTAIGGSWCSESGTFCNSITVGGGGGGGTVGGGGSNSCQTTGYCPPECFSCSGSGGRPAT